MHALGFKDHEVMAVARAQDILRARDSQDLVKVLNSDPETSNESINHFRNNANLASQISKARDFNHYSGKLGNRSDLTSLSETAQIFIQNNIVDHAAIDKFCNKRARGTVEFYVKAVTRSVPKSDPNYNAFHNFERDGLPHLWDLHNNPTPNKTFSNNTLLPPTTKHANLPPPIAVTNWRLKMLAQVKMIPLNHQRHREFILLKAAVTFCLSFLSLSFAQASEPRYDLNDYSEYFSTFTPTLKDRIRKDAQEVSRSYKMAPQEALTACANYWIYKCRALEKQGEICQNDRTKTETEFQIWLKDVNDVYKGISCLQSMRWAREKVRKNPGLYLHAE